MHYLCTLDDLKATPTIGVTVTTTITTEVEGKEGKETNSYVLLLHEGEVKAYINRCPHLNIPLEWEENAFIDNDTGLIRCATHGALFLPSTGECVSGPCAGDTLRPVNITTCNNKVMLTD